MSHRHKKLTVEVNGDDEDGRQVYQVEEHWTRNFRVWMAATASCFILGVSAIVWMDGTYLKRSEFQRHEGTVTASREELLRHESIPGHPQMVSLGNEIRLSLETIRLELGFVKAQLEDLKQRQQREQPNGNSRREGR